MSSTGALPIWTTGIFPGGKRRVSDIEYLATIESGNGPGNATLESSQVQVTTTGIGATLTATGGKDLYIARAKVSSESPIQVPSGFLVIELQQNGTPIETFTMSTEIDQSGQYEFKNIGHKVDATQTWRLNVITNTSNGHDIETMIECIEIDDGVSPRLV